MKNLYLLALVALPCVAIAQNKATTPTNKAITKSSAAKATLPAAPAAVYKPQQQPQRLNVFTAQPNRLPASGSSVGQYGYSSGYQQYAPASTARQSTYNPYSNRPVNYNVFTQPASVNFESSDEWYDE